jgi:hypothetical protein
MDLPNRIRTGIFPLKSLLPRKNRNSTRVLSMGLPTNVRPLITSVRALSLVPFEKAGEHSLIIDFGWDQPEGVILLKNQSSGQTKFAVSSFLGNVVKENTLVPQTTFAVLYTDFQKAFLTDKANEPSSGSCLHSLRIQITQKEKVGPTATLCTDNLTKTRKRFYSDWYQVVRDL